MGPLRLAALWSALVAASGCGYDEGKDLPDVVARATPPGAELVGECGGSSGLIDFPSHECTYMVSGESRDVTGAVADALVAQGFDVSCRRGDATVELSGVRGDVRVHAEVVADGAFTDEGDGAVNVFDPGYSPSHATPIPDGSVALSLGASRQAEASAAFQRGWVAGGFGCTEQVLETQTLAGCVAAWNGPDNAANRRLAMRRIRVPAAYVLLRSDGPGVASGCFFGFLARHGRYLIFESTWENLRLAYAPPELGYSSQKGFDANARVGEGGTLRLKLASLNERCEVWWNAPAGGELRDQAVARGLVADVYAVYREGRPTQCTYLLRAAGRFLRGVVTFEDGEWVTTRLTHVPPPRRFHPNGELAANGWLAVGP